MKKWAGVLAFFMASFGIGFFAGQNYEKGRKAKIPEEAPKQEPEQTAEEVAEQEGYVHTDNGLSNEIVNASNVANDEIFIKPVDDAVHGSVDFEGYMADHEKPSEENDIPEEEPVIKKVGEMPEETITYITGREFYEEQVYERIELYFYEDTLMVCDEFDTPIQHPEELVGEDVMNMLCANEADVLFTRNDWTESVYKISRVKGGFEARDVNKDYPI